MSEPYSARSYRFHPGAAKELAQAIKRLKTENLKAAEAFEKKISEALELLLIHPGIGRVIIESRGRRIRGKPLTGPFRFTIVYADLPERIFILAVAHQRRRPGYWRSRLRGL